MARPLVVGVPTEIKTDESRVALIPDGVRELESRGVEVIVQAGAGAGARVDDDAYRAAGAEVVPEASEVWARAGMVVKVKEPQPDEIGFLRDDLVLFTYLHLAAAPALADALCQAGTTALAYETVMRPDGSLPLLAPMSEIAGRLAVQAGARFLEAPQGGRGVLLAGAPGVAPGRVVVVGAGNVGWNAARVAAGMGAEVHVFDKDLDRLRFLDLLHTGAVTTLASNRGTLERYLPDADLVVGAVLVAGGRAPTVVTEAMVRTMRPGSVIVDVAIDQGGCVETSRVTTHTDPTFVEHDVVHYCVGNMPGAVPVTATHALTNATLPYITEVAVEGPAEACRRDAALARGLNVQGGRVVSGTVADALGVEVGSPSWAG